MNLRLLRECIRQIIEEITSHKLTQDDFESFFDSYGEFSSPQGVPVWAPFQLRKKFVDYTRLAGIGQMYGAIPADAAQTMKKGTRDNWKTGVKKAAYRGKGLPDDYDPEEVFTTYLEYDDRIRELAIERMALEIAGKFKSSNFEEVIAVDSSYSMSRDLAERVAFLLGLKVTTIEKINHPREVSWDLATFEKWISSGEAYESWLKARDKKAANTPDSFEGYIINTLKLLDGKDYNYIVSLLQKGEKPSALRHIKFRQKFWNFFKRLPKLENARKVLVIDDNVASGLTNVHVKERLEEAGYVPTFAAGYKR